MGEYLSVTCAAPLPGEPWRYVYTHTSVYRGTLEAGGFPFLAHWAAGVQYDVLAHARAEGYEITVRDLHWFFGWPLLGPEEFDA